jgi:hypothetical protein
VDTGEGALLLTFPSRNNGIHNHLTLGGAMRKPRIRQLEQIITSYSLAFLVAVSVPLATVHADDAQQTTPPASSAAVDSTTSTKDAGQTTSTTEPPAEPEKTYTYDNETKRWNTDEWQYDKTTGVYEPSRKQPVVTTPENLPTKENAQPVTQSTSAPTSGSVSDTEKSNSSLDSDTATSVANSLDSLAKSGDASVLRNTLAGDASSGSATSTARVINNVNSIISNNNNKEAATFVSDIMGDTNGDIILQPMLLKAMLEAGASQKADTASITNNTTLQNDLQLNAQSGDATVANNTKAGNATTGAAHTVADVVNIVNSMVSANQSFIGTINIYGNLNGDILIAPDFIPQLIANNSTRTGGNVPAASATSVETRNTQEIVNDVTLAAKSGEAIVNANTAAGNATTGDASTNLVIFNLSGHEVVAEDSLLVFVNVLGSWVGVIVDAPTGATAAAIGSGIASKQASDPSLTLAVNDSARIVNTIDLASQSGNATVQNNTLAGNATTGSATASANILNMANSQLNLTGWFGVLFINVFGSWNGSFGIDTQAGTTISTADLRKPGTSKVPLRAIDFVPRSAMAAPARTSVVSPQDITVIYGEDNRLVSYGYSGVDAASAATENLIKPEPTVLGQVATAPRRINIPLLLGSLLIIAASAFGIRRILI